MEEKLLQFGITGLIACIFAITIKVIDKRLEASNKKVIDEKDKQIEARDKQIIELIQRIQLFEDRQVQNIRDTHELMNDIKKAVEGLTDIAIGFREIVNLLIDRIK